VPPQPEQEVGEMIRGVAVRDGRGEGTHVCVSGLMVCDLMTKEGDDLGRV